MQQKFFHVINIRFVDVLAKICGMLDIWLPAFNNLLSFLYLYVGATLVMLTL